MSKATHEIMFVDPSVSDRDKELFLGPFEDSDGPIVLIQPEWTTMAHLLFAAGLFPSIKEAKRNGWNKPIPNGYDDIIVGKAKKRVITLHALDVIDAEIANES